LIAPGKDGARAALLVDYSRIWLVVAKILYRLDDQGRLLTTINLANKVVCASVDRTRSHLWVATDDEIKVLDEMGQTVLSLANARSETLHALE
jgi:ligand-binding sensor domain-containing protein